MALNIVGKTVFVRLLHTPPSANSTLLHVELQYYFIVRRNQLKEKDSFLSNVEYAYFDSVLTYNCSLNRKAMYNSHS